MRPGTKLAALVVALRRPQGATSLQLMLATGWQPHSVRGAISGLLRKRLGLNVVLTHNAAGERVTASADGQPRRKGSEFRSGPWGTHDLRTLAVLPVAGRGGSAGLQTANRANPGLHSDARKASRSRPPVLEYRQEGPLSPGAADGVTKREGAPVRVGCNDGE